MNDWYNISKAVAQLMFTYLSPETSGNQELRQCLTTFFGVYSYSSVVNQQQMMGVSLSHCLGAQALHDWIPFLQIFLRVFAELKKTRAGLKDDETMITPVQLAAMFVDLTDPSRLNNVV